MSRVDYDRIAEQISPAQLAAALGAKKSGTSWHCPLSERHSNGDRKPSFSIFRDGSRTAAKCHCPSCGLAGSPVTVAAEVWGVDLSEAAERLAQSAGIFAGNSLRIVAEYVYRDVSGQPTLKVFRYDPKGFRQQRWNGAGWDWRGEKPKLLYRLPELATEPKRLVLVVEGEKDADRLAQEGFLATTNPGGAGKWRAEFTETLAGRQVAIVPDADSPGRRHALDVARKLITTGCQLRIVPLPGHDVSDWLDAGHTADEFRELVRQAPILDEVSLGKLASAWGLIKSAGETLELTSMADLLAESSEAVEWLVENRLPTGGLSVLAGKPKAGKSTLARNLCLNISTGEPWLNMETSQGIVFYLALEEKRSEVRKHFNNMGATSEDPIFVFIAPSPQDGLEQLREAARLQKPVLIVIDPLFRFTRVKDANDYAAVTTALEPLMVLARETGAHVLTVHHLGKGSREGGDSILGSTAIFAAVDTALILKRTERYRTLSSIQRYGEDLEELVLHMDPETGVIQAGGSRAEADETQIGQAIMEYLRTQSEPAEEKDILQEVEGRRAVKVKALRNLLGQGKVERTGAGRRNDTYRYSVSCSHVPPIYREQEKKKPNFGVTDSNEKGNACSQKTDISEPESESWEQENDDDEEVSREVY